MSHIRVIDYKCTIKLSQTKDFKTVLVMKIEYEDIQKGTLPLQ